MTGSARPGTIEEALLEAPRDRLSRRFIGAWLGWRRTGRLLPKRTEMDLSDIKELLGRIILFELIAPDDIRIKVAGTQLREHADFEATGRNLAELTPPGHWPMRRWRMQEMAALPCGGVMITRDQPAIGFGGTLETVTLPVEPDEDGRPRLLLSNVAVLGDVHPSVKGRPRIVPMVDEFRFLDLGAGLPGSAPPACAEL